MKMSDVFELPLRDVEDSYPLDANGVEVMSSHEEDLATVHAINNHDALVEALEFMVCQFDAEECMYNEADLQAVSQAKNALEKARS